MILEVASLDIKPGQDKEFEAAMATAQPIIAGMPGYRGHELQKCVEAPGRYLLLVYWDTVADHMQGFRESPQFPQWKALTHPFYATPPVMHHYTSVAAWRDPMR